MVFAVTLEVIIYFAIQDIIKIDFNVLLFTLPLVLIGAILPDLIEDTGRRIEKFAGFRTHRQYLHSKRFLRIILLGIIPSSILAGYYFDQKYFALTFLFYGWATHIFTDGYFTPAGVPE